MQIIPTTKGPISVIQQGTGQPIILLHGIQGTARTWDAIAPLLSGAYRVIAPNLRGRSHSHTPTAAEDYRMSEFADDLYEVINWIREPVVLVAWSMGGFRHAEIHKPSWAGEFA